MARGRKSQGDGVSGPYRNGQRWRLAIRTGGRTNFVSFATKEDAEAVRDALAVKLGTLQIRDAIDEFIAQKAKRGIGKDGLRVSRARLISFFDARNAVYAVRDITPTRAASLLAVYAKTTSAETQYKTLAECRLFARWLRERKLIAGDPFAALKHQGKRARGKPQLTIDEARKLAALCFARAAADPAAVAVLACLYLGARSGEITSRIGRDIAMPDGRLYGIRTKKGNEVIDAEKAFPVLEGKYGIVAALAATKKEISKASLKASLSLAKPEDQTLAAAEREALKLLRDAGAVSSRADSEVVGFVAVKELKEGE